MNLTRQRGAFNLYVVALLSLLLAAGAMAALFSLRSERNLFAEGAAKAGKLVGESPAAEAARTAVSGNSGQMRSCLIHGKKVISNTDCTDQNKTSKVIQIHDSRGFEAPKKPAEPAAEPTSDKMVDKMIEKQLQ
jgi:hypothetical protein